ncbi:MAG: hypothetical protein WCI22_05580 [Actinomycetota bacterium]
MSSKAVGQPLPQRPRSRKLMVAVVAYVAALATGVGVAFAVTYDTSLHAVGNLVSYCYYARAEAVRPASNGMQVDIKAFVYKKQRTTACSSTFPGSNFYNGESEVQAVLYRASDMVVCATTGRVRTPSTTSAWGVGKTWNKSGVCATTTSFVVGAAGDWQILLNKEFRGPNIGPFPV